jgi:uncharacterized repeat protein (TIGR01451 family)
MAADIDGLPTGFQIDGNKLAAGGTQPLSEFDWNDFLSAPVPTSSDHIFTPTGAYSPAPGYSSTGIIQGDFFWDNGTEAASCPGPGDDDDTSFGESTKLDDVWDPTPANVSKKADVCSGGTAYEVVTDPGGLEHHVLYQYWTRDVHMGDMSTFLFLEGGVSGRCGDYLVEFNYDSPKNANEQAQTTVNILQWAPTGGDCLQDDGTWVSYLSDFAHDAGIGARAEGPNAPGANETFGEVAIDLTAPGLFSDDSCTAFRAGGFVTRTGEGMDPELIDYVGDSTPMVVSNCGTISISKADSDDSDASEFGYVITNGAVVHDDSLAGASDTDEPAEVLDSDDVDTSITGALSFGETHTWGPVYAGEYVIAEMIPEGAPWELWGLECTVDGETVTVVEAGVPDETAVIPVTVGGDTDCTLTNATSAVTVTKVVEGDEGETFEFDLDGDLTDAELELVGTTAGTKSEPIYYEPGTTVTVTELLGGLDWELDDVVCSDGTEGDDGEVEVTTSAGETINCVFTNLQFGSLEVTKTALGGDDTFTFDLQPLDANGDPVGAPISESVTTDEGSGKAVFDALAPGSRFSISETPTDGEWTAGKLDCTVTAAGQQGSDDIDESDFTVHPGDAISCEITNIATGTIHVTKHVVGADSTFSFTGSWLTPSGFTIETESGTKTTTFDDVLPGEYTLTEVEGDGYDGTNLVCDDANGLVVDLTATLKLEPGETITCTYTNSEWGGILVDKVALPADTGEEFGFSWHAVGDNATLFSLADETAAHPTGPIAPGDYVVSEVGAPDDWQLVSIVCTDPADDDTDPVVNGASATIHVALGEQVTCTFTNALRGGLIVDKAVAPGSPVNNGDGTWTIEYDLTVTSESNIPEDYDLEDELDFGAGIVPVTAEVTSDDGVTVNAGWDGVGDIVVATGATIPALGTHTYTVTVTADVDAELDPDAADCPVVDGEGSGFLNEASIVFWSGTDADDACAALPVSDLTITKDAPFGVDFEPAVGPTEFDYTIVVENLGPATAEDVVLEDPLPADLDFVSAVASAGTCGFDIGVGLVTCELGDLAMGETRTVTITVSIPTDYPLVEGETSFQIDNVASTSTITPESDLTNNDDDARTTVLVTLALPPEDPEDPELPTLALTGAAIGLATQLGLSLLAVGLALATMSLRRRASGRHAA